MEEEKAQANTSKRKFFFSLMRISGAGSIAGLIWGGYLNEAASAPLVIRPPGAHLNEKDFLALCIRCGQCVEACSNRYNKPNDIKTTLLLAKAGDNKPIGTPFFTPRDTPCYMCTDVPCVIDCPTGALDALNIKSKKTHKTDINLSKMGLAVIDRESCIAFWGIQCDACYRVCPLIDKAITLEYKSNKRTGKHAFLMPLVNSDHCTGCGLCEHACVTEKAAIYVLPRGLAQGAIGDHYTKGWEKSDEGRIKSVPKRGYKTKTKRSEQRAIDYLNRGDLLDDIK